MKFSYTLIKKFLPELKSKKQLIDALNLYAFETEDHNKNTIDVSIPTNRYSNAASHIGIAEETKTILNLKRSKIPELKAGTQKKEKPTAFDVEVKDTKLCPRYTAQFFDDVKIKSSPKWLKDVLMDCGLRPINNVVDLMNYVMLETGQPLHAFDADKIENKRIPKIVIRKAKQGESIVSIDGNSYALTPSMLVIADSEKPLAIAGIKGGKGAEVSKETKSIIVESASFDATSVYKTSQQLSLVTDASVRFSHHLHPELAVIGLKRARELLQEIVGAKPGDVFDSSPQKFAPRKLTFDINWFNRFIGTELSVKEAVSFLRRLGLKTQGKKVEIPIFRQDIETREDIAEEVVRLIGYNKLASQPPLIGLASSEFNERFRFKDNIRNILSGFGFDEVYNTSFVGEGGAEVIEVENPVAEDKKFLRSSLLPLLSGNVKDNLRFYDEVRIFEAGKIFAVSGEKNALGIAAAAKNRDLFFELKGAVEQLLKGLGLTDFFMVEFKGKERGLRIKSGRSVIGRLIHYDKRTSLAELDMETLLQLVEGELSYAPLPKYPAVIRDISVLVEHEVRIGKIIQEIQLSNVHLIQDVDLIDEYLGGDDKRQSITLRIVFRADDRTLNAKEVDKEMKKINLLLERNFGAEIR